MISKLTKGISIILFATWFWLMSYSKSRMGLYRDLIFREEKVSKMFSFDLIWGILGIALIYLIFVIFHYIRNKSVLQVVYSFLVFLSIGIIYMFSKDIYYNLSLIILSILIFIDLIVVIFTKKKKNNFIFIS